MSLSKNIGVAALVAALLVASAGGNAYAQTKGDVDKAQQEANRAKAALGDAQNAANIAGQARDAVEADLLARLDAVQQTSTDLETAAGKVADLRGQIDATELEVRQLRQEAEQRAVEAYMGAWSTDIGVVALSANLTQAFIIADVAETVRQNDLAQINELTIQRRVLDGLRSDQEAEQQRLQGLQDDLNAQVDTLQQLFMQADTTLRAAYLAVDEADRHYQSALNSASAAQQAYEEAQRKLRIGGGVERWRPIVQQYFPPDLVDQALAVMSCESGGNPDAVNRYSGAAGLFQFLKGTWAIASSRAGFSGYSRFDPEANIASAAWLVDYSIRSQHAGGAWGRWSCRP
jgi:peptidoglycan hydrolase CwlO-like protein